MYFQKLFIHYNFALFIIIILCLFLLQFFVLFLFLFCFVFSVLHGLCLNFYIDYYVESKLLSTFYLSETYCHFTLEGYKRCFAYAIDGRGIEPIIKKLNIKSRALK